MKNVDSILNSKNMYQKIVFDTIKKLKLCGDGLDIYDKMHNLIEEMK
jgi:glycosyltransferase involved in cell wall biosynthesis